MQTPLRLTLADLKAMAQRSQITKHQCIQGWSGIAEWAGVPLSEILNRCHPTPGRTLHDVHLVPVGRQRSPISRVPTHRNGAASTNYPGATTMNFQPLSVPHGAPLRLRVETQLGFKMVKWLHRIEFIASYSGFGDGQGGSREDIQNFEPYVSV